MVSGGICIDFWYHMLGTEDLNELKVIVQDEAKETEVWHRHGNQSSSWMYGFKTVSFEAEKRIKVTDTKNTPKCLTRQERFS